MSRLLFLLLFVMVMAVNVFAQGTDTDPKNVNFDPVSWNKDVDSTTQWGKWLINVVKPYWDQITIAKKNYAERVFLDEHKGLPTNEAIEQEYTGFYKDMDSIITPSELSDYHLKVLKVCQYTPQEISKDKDLQNKIDLLSAECNAEFKKILEGHNVPQNVIDEFIGK